MKTPICLITGFLGSGKTTLLKKIAIRHKSNKLVYLINDFSPQDIDGTLVSEENPDVVSIPGGSIFCKCLVTEFIGTLNKIPEIFPDTEGIIIEASGMANPKVIETMLKETKLEQIYTLCNIITVIDPASFHKLRHTLPNIIDQVESSDIIIINKSDLHSQHDLNKTELSVRGINQMAEIIYSSFGDTEFALFADNNYTRNLQGEYAPCKDPNYNSCTIKFDSDINIEALTNQILEIKSELYRVKGFIPADGKSYYFDYSASGITCTETAKQIKQHSLVVIHKGSTHQHTIQQALPY
jgi:G3E family GTPase